MKKIKVIDVTLRDGGCINDFNFGNDDMNIILAGLNKSGVDYIEVGYINSQKGSENGRAQFINEGVIRENFLKRKEPGKKYVAMIDYGTFDVNRLNDRTEDDIDGIRFAFHKKDAKEIVDIGKIVMSKGYEFFIQPMLTLRYSDFEFLELIDLVNRELPDASGFYVVDTFGEMRHNDVVRALYMVDHNLIKGMPFGFHSHNNLQLSYANAISAMQFPSSRDFFIDSSIMGMGKGAGNLNTELLLEHLNLYFGGQYDISELLNIMDTVLNRIKAEYSWGYSAEYYLSAIHRCSPSYAQHFQQKHMLPVDQISNLLGSIAEDKKISFDKDYADNLYCEYMSHEIDDKKAIDVLTELFSGKKALLLAPGYSSEEERDKIIDYINNNNVVTVSINTVYDKIQSDYVFIANRRRFKNLTNRIEDKSIPPIICTSNIQISSNQNAYVVNYSDYVCKEQKIESNAGMMAINLMCKLNIDELILAGFDGYMYQSHRKDAPLDPINISEYNLLNKLIANHLNEVCKKMKIKYLTKSIYSKGE